MANRLGDTSGAEKEPDAMIVKESQEIPEPCKVQINRKERQGPFGIVEGAEKESSRRFQRPWGKNLRCLYGKKRHSLKRGGGVTKARGWREQEPFEKDYREPGRWGWNHAKERRHTNERTCTTRLGGR